MNEKEVAEFLKSKGWGVIHPSQYLIDFTKEYKDIWQKVSPFTMISPERGWALYEAIGYVTKRNILGDFVECGVWRGGSCMLMAYTLKNLNEERKLWLYDTYEGMSEPTDKDKIAVSGEAVSNRFEEGWWAVDVEQVKKNLISTGYPEKNCNFVKGDVAKTLSQKKPETIALLRLDTDWYESTKIELETLYPLLQKGGVILIDDYGHFTGAREAVDEFRAKLENAPFMHRSDYTGRLWIKE